jgi:peptidoglycan-associated lipoprotein
MTDPPNTHVGNTIYFDTDSAGLTADAQSALQKQAQWLLQWDHEHTFIIEGHADERGTREYNLALGERRAQAVMDYLVALGVDAKRLKTISYGKERPVCTDAAEACWSENRRAVSTLDD